MPIADLRNPLVSLYDERLVTSQTGEGLVIRICRRRLSVFSHVLRLPEATRAHSALRLAVDTRAGGRSDYSEVEAPARTRVDAADRGRHRA